MPGIDHPTHTRTVKPEDHRYGCWNLPANLSHRMSDRCRYDKSLSDASCDGCLHRGKGEAYDQLIREQGT